MRWWVSGEQSYLVTHTPDGDTDALGHVQARLEHSVVVRLLLGQLCAGDILGDSDIQLGDG